MKSSRRKVLVGTGSAIAVLVSGCLDDDGGEPETDDTDGDSNEQEDRDDDTEADDSAELSCPPSSMDEAEMVLPSVEGFRQRNTSVAIGSDADTARRIYESPEEELYAVTVDTWDSEAQAQDEELSGTIGYQIISGGYTVNVSEVMLGRTGAATVEVAGQDVPRVEELYEAVDCFGADDVVGRSWE